jgi:hypothetical protein
MVHIILPPIQPSPRPQSAPEVPRNGEQPRRRMAIDSVLNPDEGCRGSPSTSSVTSERPSLPSWSAINGNFSRQNSITDVPSWSSININIRSREPSSSSDSNPDYRPLDYSPQTRPYSSSPRPYNPSRRHSISQDRNNLSHYERRSSSARRERREMRPTYAPEEELFIWYHRVDLDMNWGDIREAYNAQFPDRQRKGFQGIQCKYYRCCEANGVPRVRDRNRLAGEQRRYWLRTKLPHLWYPWMREEGNGRRMEEERERERGQRERERL